MFPTIKYIKYIAVLQNVHNSHINCLSASTLLYNHMYSSYDGMCKQETSKNITTLNNKLAFKPIQFQDVTTQESFGEELSGPLDTLKISSILNKFHCDTVIQTLAAEERITGNIFTTAMASFKKYIETKSPLPTEIHLLLFDLTNDSTSRHIHDLYVYFADHAKQIYPHLHCMDSLCKIADLSKPHDYYPVARNMTRKIIFHAGPTNSGKTYMAMKSFLAAKTGIYVGPLKMLAAEVHLKANSAGQPCDLITGESHQYAFSENKPATHVASTVEMTPTHKEFEVAVIDEIQMMKDKSRGWAWTRAFLGVPAKEVHVCGEYSAVDLVKRTAAVTGDSFELHEYKRLTGLSVEKKALKTWKNIKPGDCIICFSMKDIHTLVRDLELLGHAVAVIYGSLPPGAKYSQAEKFNNPDDKCKIMIATDAIGMGINLNIKRIIFYSLMRPSSNEIGNLVMVKISVSSALQISGRAGRYGTPNDEGSVTTFHQEDLPILEELLASSPPKITQAGLHPNPDQIELFAYHLRNYDMAYLVDVFCKICTIDNQNYFVCFLKDFKYLANLIKHIELDLRSKYVFCTAPINTRKPFLCAVLQEFALQYSKNIPVDYDWMEKRLKWPFTVPKKLQEHTHLEEIHDVFETYFWLSYRFPDIFPDREILLVTQKVLDDIINEGLSKLSKLPVEPNVNGHFNGTVMKNGLTNTVNGPPRPNGNINSSVMQNKSSNFIISNHIRQTDNVNGNLNGLSKFPKYTRMNGNINISAEQEKSAHFNASTVKKELLVNLSKCNHPVAEMHNDTTVTKAQLSNLTEVSKKVNANIKNRVAITELPNLSKIRDVHLNKEIFGQLLQLCNTPRENNNITDTVMNDATVNTNVNSGIVITELPNLSKIRDVDGNLKKKLLTNLSKLPLDTVQNDNNIDNISPKPRSHNSVIDNTEFSSNHHTYGLINLIKINIQENTFSINNILKRQIVLRKMLVDLNESLTIDKRATDKVKTVANNDGRSTKARVLSSLKPIYTTRCKDIVVLEKFSSSRLNRINNRLARCLSNRRKI